MDDIEPLIEMVRERISLQKNKRLREALSERGDPAVRLAKELPAAVAIEWGEEYPDREPPVYEDEISDEEIRSLRRRVVRRLEKQSDEEADKIIRAFGRMPASGIDEDAEFEAREIVEYLVWAAGLSESERDVFQLSQEIDDDGEIAEIMGWKRETVAKTRSRGMKKLRKAAAEGGFSEKLKKT